jgi:mitochondrial fission protein ELM1
LSPAAPAPLVLWRFTDGRRGHDAQSRGLALALAARRSAQVIDVPVPGAARALLDLLTGRCAAGATLPDPDLLVGAGHATHLPLLAARRARGGRTVLLMRPSLPASCFDLCLIPDHDGVPERGNVVLTRGPLNAMRPGPGRGAAGGLILIGGASRHYAWPEATLLDRLRSVLATPGPWTVSDSPRTPASTRDRLRALPGIRYLPWETGDADALARELAGAASVWITADSLSMIYEALSAGAAVGVIELPGARAGDRIAEALHRLRADGWLTGFGDWRPGSPLPPPPAPLAEASRCAGIVLDRLC